MFRRKWPRSSKVLFALATLSGVTAFVLVQDYVARVQDLYPSVGPAVSVVVAAEDLARGTTIGEEMVRLESVPSDLAPPAALTAADDAAGRVLQAAIAAGEVLTRTRLAHRGVGPVAALVPPGLRAVVVPTSVPPAVVRPGDLVDVLATYGGGRPYSETVASGLEVLRVLDGVGQASAIAGGGDVGSLVLLASPDVAERLAFAAAFATVAIAIAGGEPAAFA
jgi:Flp pilus assembly protein CpaB